MAANGHWMALCVMAVCVAACQFMLPGMQKSCTFSKALTDATALASLDRRVHFDGVAANVTNISPSSLHSRTPFSLPDGCRKQYLQQTTPHRKHPCPD